MRGHIRRRGKRSWQLILPASRDPVTGKRRQQSRNVQGTRKDAQVALARWIHEIETGLDFDARRLTVAEYLNSGSPPKNAGCTKVG